MDACEITTVPASTRQAIDEDLNFIYHSWLKSYRASWARGSNPVRHMNKEIYYDNQKEVIAYLLDNSFVLVAHNPQDSNQIFGYIVAQPTSQGIGIIHYCFVKQPFRNLGIATMLLNEAKAQVGHNPTMPMACTHATGVFHGVLSKKYNIMYNPYLIYRSLINEDRCFEDSSYYKM